MAKLIIYKGGNGSSVRWKVGQGYEGKTWVEKNYFKKKGKKTHKFE